jgi:cytochrome c
MVLGRSWVLASLLAASFFACGGSAEPAAGPLPPTGGGAGAVDTGKALAAQIDDGKTVYKEHCASCHGTKGEGDSAPAIVGAKALSIAPPAGAKTRKSEFKNAADVEAFVKSAMPIDAPGTLSDAQAFAVVAWELHNSGTELGGVALDASNATAIHVH